MAFPYQLTREARATVFCLRYWQLDVYRGDPTSDVTKNGCTMSGHSSAFDSFYGQGYVVGVR